MYRVMERYEVDKREGEISGMFRGFRALLLIRFGYVCMGMGGTRDNPTVLF